MDTLNKMSLIIAILIGGGLGAALGYYGQCSSGTCPLTANWKRGALYGMALGLVFHFASGSGGATTKTVNESSANVKRISEAEFESEVLKASVPVVVDFYAPWCGPCRKLSPLLDEMATPRTGQVKFVKINVDEAASLSRQYQVQGVPTLMFFKDGKIVDSIVGLPRPGILEAKLDALAKGA
jgi:thioredoxin 1